MQPKYLYKYVTKDRLDIIENGMIRFTQPSALNDPFELQPLFENLLPEEKIQEALNPTFEYFENVLRDEYRKQPDNVRALISEDQLVSLVKNNPDFISNAMKNVEPGIRKFIKEYTPEAKSLMYNVMDSKIGILSLSENICHPLLWTHYSGSHTGFAIEFDTSNPFFNRRRSASDELYHLREVDYATRESKGRTLYDLDGRDILLTKSEDWRYESEWRMLAPLFDASKIIISPDGNIHLFSFPMDAITSLVVGAKASVNFMDELSDQTKKYLGINTSVKKAFIDVEHQKIDIDKL